MKKILLIPILIIIYIFFVNSLSQIGFEIINVYEEQTGGGVGEVIGIGQSVGVSVTRPYLFGLFSLPVYVEGFGNIGIMHDVFFTFIFILAISLIIIEIRGRKQINARKTKRKGG